MDDGDENQELEIRVRELERQLLRLARRVAGLCPGCGRSGQGTPGCRDCGHVAPG
jgi:hypothetical protein